MTDYLVHYGIKGQKWGVRRYQYADGSLTPSGKKRYSSNTSGFNKLMKTNVKHMVNSARTQITGKQYVDGCLKSGVTLSRIQTSENFEKFAFYATYKKHDIDEYMGLFGKNLMSRANAEAKRAEKKAEASGSEEDFRNANDLRSKANNTKVYQLKLQATKKLKIPSDENASDITANLLKEPDFKKNVVASIIDSKEKMKRPTQQVLFNQALNAIDKEPNKMNSSDKKSIYKALNLSLVNHNSYEIAAQDRFYSELKKKGYNALLDYNDKEYSSYHAKRPMIVFDVDSVKLQSVTEANPKVVDKLYRRYNAERIVKEIPANTIGLITKAGNKTISDCRSYVDDKYNSYLGLETDTKTNSKSVDNYKREHPGTKMNNREIYEMLNE